MRQRVAVFVITLMASTGLLTLAAPTGAMASECNGVEITYYCPIYHTYGGWIRYCIGTPPHGDPCASGRVEGE
jgi:hypothetical protein